MTNRQLGKRFQPFAPYFLAVALSFLIYQLYLVQNSFSALRMIAISTTARNQATGSLWPLLQLSSEISGEVGLLLRLVDACLLVILAWLFLRKRELSFSLMKKAVLLEAAYFLFYLPFVIYLLTNPGHSVAGVEAGISYALQIGLVTPSLLMLYLKLKKQETEGGKSQIAKWFAVAFCCYVSSLWVKHFIFAMYSVGFNFTTLVLAVGSLNSVATLLITSVASLVVFLPVIRGERTSFDLKAVGGILICIGTYFIIFILVSLVNANYSNWVGLIEWWATALPILGLSFVFVNHRKAT